MDKLKVTVQVTLSMGAIVGLIGCGEMPADNAESASNGGDYAKSVSNGLSSVNGLSSTNGLTGTNGLSSTNGLSMTNGLSSTNGL